MFFAQKKEGKALCFSPLFAYTEDNSSAKNPSLPVRIPIKADFLERDGDKVRQEAENGGIRL